MSAAKRVRSPEYKARRRALGAMARAIRREARRKDLQDLGARIRACRRRLRLTQLEFAQSVGVGQRMIWGLEAGTKPFLRQPGRLRIERFLADPAAQAEAVVTQRLEAKYSARVLRDVRAVLEERYA